MNRLSVLSLFDGMSCGRIALDRAGIPVKHYFASEIDKHAITVSKANWQDIEHVGDVTKLESWYFPKIDLLIGGSPCQGFSFAGKQLSFSDPRSKLFFEFVRLLKQLRERETLSLSSCWKTSL
jgi:DNA-cytosine methyltransferase